MKTIVHLAGVLALAFAAGCTTLFPPAPLVGETEAEVVAKRGQPTNRYQDGNTKILEYAYGPWGQQTYMARFGPDGRLQSFEQVLTQEKFGEVQLGKTTRNDVLVTFGRPDETSYLPLKDYEVWTYAYTGSGVWNSLMHVHFDRSGIVQLMVREWDPRYHQHADWTD